AAQLGRDRERPQQDGGPPLVDQNRPVADRGNQPALLIERYEAKGLERRHVLAQTIDGPVEAVRPERRLGHVLDRRSVARPLTQGARAPGFLAGTSSQDPSQPGPSAAMSSRHSRRLRPLDFWSTFSPAIMRFTAVSPVLERCRPPMRYSMKALWQMGHQ